MKDARLVLPRKALVRLELYAEKLACTVNRGLGTGNRPRLPGIENILQPSRHLWDVIPRLGVKFNSGDIFFAKGQL
jgi:hypothetical protein